MSENRVIGHGGKIPWYLPEDFKWFKASTMGGILVMGRKSYESIGRPLPGRDTYVLSRQVRKIPGIHSFTDLSVLDHLDTDKTIWIAGGSEIYEQMLPKCSELYLSRIHREVEGDTFFPEFKDRFRLNAIVRKTDDFTVEHWLRIRTARL